MGCGVSKGTAERDADPTQSDNEAANGQAGESPGSPAGKSQGQDRRRSQPSNKEPQPNAQGVGASNTQGAPNGIPNPPSSQRRQKIRDWIDGKQPPEVPLAEGAEVTRLSMDTLQANQRALDAYQSNPDSMGVLQKPVGAKAPRPTTPDLPPAPPLEGEGPQIPSNPPRNLQLGNPHLERLQSHANRDHAASFMTNGGMSDMLNTSVDGQGTPRLALSPHADSDAVGDRGPLTPPNEREDPVTEDALSPPHGEDI